MKKLNSTLKKIPGIIYTNINKEAIVDEQFIFEHGISYIISGSIKVVLGNETKVFGEGEYIFYQKNFLARFTKQLSVSGKFQCITVILDSGTLSEYYRKYPVKLDTTFKKQHAVSKIKPAILLKNYFRLLMPFFAITLPEQLEVIKKQEAIVILLQINPELKNKLFNFRQPGKIDLELFMQTNFKFKVDLKRFAYLTGRSLASFKRDFEKIFHTSPSRWLQQKRLEEAYYLINEKNKRPSDVYREVGFESMAHFSYSFKKKFGVNPSKLNQSTR